ncbi:zinc ABC transporter substrate-binding protein [Mameliella alba]|uniref:zinc ABC transporter substrate-binding protein n=1 Tax=Mameliella alba TaxID=561184 RepID=UPI000B535EFB|nr:zinc ABC transporter substrate-binding protein [Mameliella alba]MBY6118379.1 zinc ABC transporter substrate-binding protein [Mameliella alba]OWV43344.1 zinc transporter [Mameliella alba]OWV68481.1 zinc transporter [Mameliella alba]
MLRPLLLSACIALPQTALAEVPRVVTDIGPVESLVATVLGNLGTPERLLSPGDSPHHMALRPSQGRALSDADVVVWVGPDLTPQLQEQIDALAGSALSLPLGEAPGTHLLPFRDTGLFPHEHDEHEEHRDEHDEHEDDHDDDHHDDHAEEHHAHDGHGAHDPHIWLSPENATLWLSLIAEALSQADPENAATYVANAKAGARTIAETVEQARAALDPVAGRPLALAHDAYQYYEEFFGLSVIGAISDADANTPGPSRLAALRDGLAEQGAACVLTEATTDPRLLEAVKASGLPSVQLDPLGTDLPQGTALYPALILETATRIAGCAGN